MAKIGTIEGYSLPSLAPKPYAGLRGYGRNGLGGGVRGLGGRGIGEGGGMQRRQPNPSAFFIFPECEFVDFHLVSTAITNRPAGDA